MIAISETHPIAARHADPVKAIAYSPRGDLLACADTARNLQVWRDGEPLWKTNFRFWYDRFLPHMYIRAVAFSLKGDQLYVAVDDTLRAYRPETGEELWRFRARPTFGFLRTRPNSLSVARDGRLAIAYDDSTVEIRDPDGWPTRRLSAWRDNDAPSLLAFLGDDRIAGTDHVSVCIWDAGLGTKLAKYVPFERIHAIAAHPDGHMVAIRTLYEIKLYAVADGSLVASTAIRPGLPTLLFSPRGDTIAAGDSHGVTLFDGEARETLRFENDAVTLALAFAPDGKNLALACSDGFVRLIKA